MTKDYYADPHKHIVHCTLVVDETKLTKAFDKERGAICEDQSLEGKIKDQFHWVQGSGIKLQKIQEIT